MTQIIAKIPLGENEATHAGDGWFEALPWYPYIESWQGPPSMFWACSGMRFQIDIPQGAIIDSAFLYLNTGLSGTFYDGKLYANAVDNSPDFIDVASVWETDLRPRTEANVLWYENIAVGGEHESPDITDVIQEIISRGGWVANNYLMILFIANTDEDRFGNWIGRGLSAVDCARLEIEYHLPLGAPIYHPKKKAFSGYHCFMEQYIKNKQAGVNAYKLPDGTLW